MKKIRIYHPENLADKTQLELTQMASHHLTSVLRCRMEEQIILFDGSGVEYVAIISAIEKNRVQVKLLQSVVSQRESPLFTELGQGISRGERMDFVLQKAVELGVSAITPLFTQRCNVKLDTARQQRRMQHWQNIIISACEQSGRVKLPVLYPPQPLLEWLALTRDGVKLLLTPEASSANCPFNGDIPAKVTVLIGPEGGLTAEEITAALQTDFAALRLGPRVLRTETAALAALTVVQSRWGDL